MIGMKNIVFKLFALLMLFVACQEVDPVSVIPVTGVSLDQSSVEMVAGEEIRLIASITPEGATNKNVTWLSSNTDAANVSDGKVTARKAGVATIAVMTEDGNKTAYCKVTVSPKTISVTGVSLDQSYVELVEGDEVVLAATVSPENATNKNIVWLSSDDSVVSVSEGVLTAHKEGTATIAVRTEDGNKTASCKVTVSPKIISVTEVSLDHSSLELVEGDELVLTATVSPEDATNKNVVWSSSDASVVSVSEGVLTAHKAGAATITVETEDGNLTASCAVSVRPKPVPVTGVSLHKSSVEMFKGDELQLNAMVYPEDATNKNVRWVSDNESVASVSAGKVIAHEAGTATISVITEDGNMTANCKVTVRIPVTGVSLNMTSAEMVEGDELTLSASVYPEDATDKNVVWSSDNTSVATVSEGVVKAHKAGTATITVETEDGSKTASCKLTVTAKYVPVTDISLDITYAEMIEGDELQLTATVYPENATNKNIKWSRSSSIVSVTDGKVTAHKEGNAKIYATTEDGSKVATCEVKISKKHVAVTGVSLNKTEAELTEGESLNLTATINPSDASNKNVTWKSSNTTVATVSDGVVIARKAGTATITVKTDEGNKTATCKVTVKEKQIAVTRVSLNKTSAELTEGQELTLVATVYPNNATNKAVKWSSSDESVAKVLDGCVTAVKPGTAVITVKTVDGNKSASCTVKVVSSAHAGGNENVGENEGDW